jgi:RHS repeat-associated protein
VRARFVGLLLVVACGPRPRPAYLLYLRDRQGSLIGAVDDRGTKVWETRQDSYGLRLASAGVPVPRGFLDQPLDKETGFYHFRYRDYDPATAQWLSPEPALLEKPDKCAERPQLCNPYAYAGDRPGEWADRDGRWATIVQEGSEIYAYESLGVTGPDSTQAVVSLLGGRSLVDPASHLHVILQVQIYPDLASMPPSLTRVVADFSNPQGRSELKAATSTIYLRGDAATGTREVLAHEIGHSLGLSDHYFELFGHTFNQPGAHDDLMANFWISGRPQLDRSDAMELLHPEFPRNLGLQEPTSSSEWTFSVPPKDALMSPTWLGNPM